MNDHSDLKAAFKEAKRQLERAGWQHILSQMSDCAQGTEYGLLFAKGDKQYWLNVETINRAPDC